jgi:Protein of unknown function (DUF4232)
MGIASVLIAGCGGSAPTAPGMLASAAASATPAQRGHACGSSQLRLSTGPRISEATQQNTLLLLFRNVSAAECVMRGYPAIALADSAGHRLEFGYRRLGDQMLTSAPPGLVTLPPGGSAYSALNKNSCVGFAPRSAASADVTPPGQREPLVLKLPRYPILGYCGAGDPGHTIDIAPIEPARAGVLAHG